MHVVSWLVVSSIFYIPFQICFVNLVRLDHTRPILLTNRLITENSYELSVASVLKYYRWIITGGLPVDEFSVGVLFVILIISIIVFGLHVDIYSKKAASKIVNSQNYHKKD